MRKPVAAAGNTILYAIGKRTVVCGLAWEVLQRRDTATRSVELAEIAKRRGSSYAVLLQTSSGRTFGGFVPADAPAKAKSSTSAAVWLAVSVERPTVYIEQVGDDRWWYVVVRPGEVDVSTDRIGTGIDVAAALDDMLAEAVRDAEWSETQVIISGVAPPVRLIEQNVITPLEGTFEQLVDLDRVSDPRTQIKRVVGGVSPIVLIAVVAVAAAVLFGVTWYVMKVLRERAELEAARAAALAEERNAAEMATLNDKRISDAVAAALAGDTATPAPDDVIHGCLSTFSTIPAYVGGWSMGMFECTPNSATSRWGRARGDLSDNATLAAQIQQWGTPTFDPTGINAVVGLRMQGFSNRPAIFPEKLPAQNVVWVVLGTWAQRLEHDTHVAIDLSTPAVKALQYADPRVNEGKNGLSPVPEEKLYRTGALKISGRGALALSAMHFAEPYVSLTSLRITTHGGTDFDWNLEGSYVLANH